MNSVIFFHSTSLLTKTDTTRHFKAQETPQGTSRHIKAMFDFTRGITAQQLIIQDEKMRLRLK